MTLLRQSEPILWAWSPRRMETGSSRKSWRSCGKARCAVHTHLGVPPTLCPPYPETGSRRSTPNQRTCWPQYRRLHSSSGGSTRTRSCRTPTAVSFRYRRGEEGRFGRGSWRRWNRPGRTRWREPWRPLSMDRSSRRCSIELGCSGWHGTLSRGGCPLQGWPKRPPAEERQQRRRWRRKRRRMTTTRMDQRSIDATNPRRAVFRPLITPTPPSGLCSRDDLYRKFR